MPHQQTAGQWPPPHTGPQPGPPHASPQAGTDPGQQWPAQHPGTQWAPQGPGQWPQQPGPGAYGGQWQQPQQPPSEQQLLPTVLGGLALRDLTLVESLLRVVEELEEHEDDPGQLQSLFKIDHLATRMRRNGENLLVLAGQETGAHNHDATPLLDVVRAAVSEVTHYDRVRITPMPAAYLVGLAADDISHLLAELIDNATSQSPQHTQVIVQGGPTSDGAVVLAIADHGIGIPLERLAHLNARLAGPPFLDVSVTRHMGLYVVSRLAYRHGIRVQLQTQPHGGTVAYVALPARLLRAAPATASTEAEPAAQQETSAGFPQRDAARSAAVAASGSAAPAAPQSPGPAHAEGSGQPATGGSSPATPNGPGHARATVTAEPHAPVTVTGERPAPATASTQPQRPAAADDPPPGPVYPPAGRDEPFHEELSRAGESYSPPVTPAGLPQRTPQPMTATAAAPGESAGEDAAVEPPVTETGSDSAASAGSKAAEAIRADLSGFQSGRRAAEHGARSEHAGEPPEPGGDTREAEQP